MPSLDVVKIFNKAKIKTMKAIVHLGTNVDKFKPPADKDTAKRKMVHLYGFLEIASGAAHAFKTLAQTGKITVLVLKKLAKVYAKKRIVIFWDNASWHKSKEVKKFLDTTKQFQLYLYIQYF